MMTTKTHCIALGLAGAFLSTLAAAADKILAPVQLDSVAVIAAPVGQHKAGNVEIAVRNGFSLAGLSCTDPYWVTTLKTTDPDGSMLAMLAAIRSGAVTNASIMITDDPALTAYPGRCSIRALQR